MRGELAGRRCGNENRGLRVNQLSEAGFDWYRSYLEAMDALDIDRLADFLAEDCVMQMNNDPPVEGKATIVAGLTGYWQSFASIEHDLLNIYGDDRRFALEALNHYRRHDGKPVTLRAVAFTDRGANGLASSIRLYTDMQPLFAD